MVTDARLKSAAAEAERALLASLEAEQKEPREFSETFHKKMRKLIHRSSHPVYQVLRYVAVVTLVLAILFGTVMAVSPEVRAAVTGWFRAAFVGPYAHYDNMDVTGIPDAAAEMEYDYYLPTIPEGYALWQEIEKLEGKTYMYLNEATGNILFFNYAYAKGIGDAFVDVGGYTHERVRIGQLEGDLYTTSEEGESNVLVWSSKHGGVLFELAGDIDPEKLVRMAESIQCRERTPEEET